MAVEVGQWLFQDRQVMTRWGRAEPASKVQTGTAVMLTLCGRPAARDADPAHPARRCTLCFLPAPSADGAS